MKRPPLKTLVFGHKTVATPLMLAGGVTLFAAFRDSNLFVGLIAVAVLLAVRSAHEEASAYRTWKREWDAMGGDPPRGIRHWFEWLGALAIVAAVVAVIYSGKTIQHWSMIGLGALVGGWLVLLVVWVAMRWLARSCARVGSFTVAVLACPVMPVPALTDAYRALPPYCQSLLRRVP